MQASIMARLSAPWQVACTITLRAKPSWSRSATSCAFEASQGVYLRSGANGNSAPGPKTWQCASTAPGGRMNCGFDGLAYQASQPGVFVNACWVIARDIGRRERPFYRFNPCSAATAALRAVARWNAGLAASRSEYAVNAGRGSTILNVSRKRSVPPKMVSAIVKRSPSSQGPAPIAASVASSMASYVPQPTAPALKAPPEALAAAAGSMTEGENRDQRR